MSNVSSNKMTSSSVVAKAGIWYTICNFLFRGMAFITTPIFTRLLTKSEIGSFTNFTSWINILIVVTAFDLQTSIIRSKLEHEEDMDSYVWSILSLTSLATLVVYGIVCLFPSFFINLFQMEMKYIHVMFVYLLVSPAYQMLITKQRAFYKYKTFVVLTGITLVSATLMSLIMVFIAEDKLAGRLYGYYVPFIFISAIIYLYLAFKGRKIKVSYWRYACVICLPLVPHVLSLHLLNSSDKILINQFLGEEFTAIYGIAYSCYHIATILFDSMNKAWAPWLLESLHHENYEGTKSVSKMYVGLFVVAVVGVLLLVPEIIWILGGKGYEAAIYCLPPLITSCVFQLVYTMYVNVEFYMKKTIGVAGATIIATLLNLVLDMYLVPRYPQYGHIIAAYTTLAGFVVLFVLHYLMVKKMGMAHVFDIKYNVMILGVISIVSIAMNLLYSMSLLRYVCVCGYGLLVVFGIYKNRHVLLTFVSKRKKRK